MRPITKKSMAEAWLVFGKGMSMVDAGLLAHNSDTSFVDIEEWSDLWIASCRGFRKLIEDNSDDTPYSRSI